jgi:AAA domain
MRSFVVISGLPGSGKTTPGLRLAEALSFRLIDKDTVLDRLFEEKGVGDAPWRRALSREADVLFRTEAGASEGAILVSHWRLPGMPPDSGTDPVWLHDPSIKVVHVQCVCPPETAARRFLDRQRHPGHLDAAKSYEEVVASFDSIAALGALDLLPRIDFETSEPGPIDGLIEVVRAVFSTPIGSRERPALP